jgi:hypothetical protein
MDEVEVGKVLDFAENLLLNPTDVWQQSSLNQKLSHTLEFNESLPGPQDCSPSGQLLGALAKKIQASDATVLTETTTLR